MTTCKNQNNKVDYSYGVYNYYFYESTGDNKYIEIEGIKNKIVFNRKKSNKEALQSLSSLKWTVLYPNSKGNIKLFGYYSKEKIDFILLHWQLLSPFTKYVENQGEKIPTNWKEERNNYLQINDFEKEFRFNPAKYNKPIEKFD
jgi:hypothetical protein